MGSTVEGKKCSHRSIFCPLKVDPIIEGLLIQINMTVEEVKKLFPMVKMVKKKHGDLLIDLKGFQERQKQDIFTYVNNRSIVDCQRIYLIVYLFGIFFN